MEEENGSSEKEQTLIRCVSVRMYGRVPNVTARLEDSAIRTQSIGDT